jgi:hypothetical protein
MQHPARIARIIEAGLEPIDRARARSSTSRISSTPASLLWLSSRASMATEALKERRCGSTLSPMA